MKGATGRRIVVLALATYLALCTWLVPRLPAWHEGVTVHPGPGLRVLRSPRPDAAPTLVYEPSCADPEREGERLRSEVRPELQLCHGGRRYPVMIMAYASGVLYWPSALLWSWHRGDLFDLRWLGVASGLVSLLLTAALVRRLAGPRLALGALALVAVTSPFVLLHSTLIHYETAPWLFIVAGMLLLAGSPELAPAGPAEGRPALARILGAGACFGAALLCNLKAAFLLAPLAVIAWRGGVRFDRIGPLRGLAGLGAATLALLPFILATLGESGGVEGQIDQRLAAIVANLDPLHVVAELANLALFGADMQWYLLLASGEWGLPSIAATLSVGAGAVYCIVVALRFLTRGQGCPVAAASGALLMTFWLVSALLYTQWPAANHSPIAAVYGVALACAAAALGRRFGPRARPRIRDLGAATTALAAATLLWSDVQRGSPAAYMNASINAAAERALAAHLVERPLPGALITTTYNYAGILESLGDGALTPIVAHRYLDCPGEDLRCLSARLELLLASTPAPARLVVPARAAPIDEESVALLPEAIRQAAAALDRDASVEATFTSERGVALVWLFRVDPPRPRR